MSKTLYVEYMIPVLVQVTDGVVTKVTEHGDDIAGTGDVYDSDFNKIPRSSQANRKTIAQAIAATESDEPWPARGST